MKLLRRSTNMLDFYSRNVGFEEEAVRLAVVLDKIKKGIDERGVARKE